MIVCINDHWVWKHDGTLVTENEALILFPELVDVGEFWDDV
jgi:hypothetical protein